MPADSAFLLPAFDPVAFSLGPLVVRWYALAYIGGILFGWWYIRFLDRKGWKLLTREHADDLVFHVVLGIILGGRLGYVLFYNLAYFMEHPSHVFRVWEGGMSFHGGMIGFILAVLLYCRRRGLPFFGVMDVLAAAAPVGICLGRLANFVNGELFGRPTEVPWAMVFPAGGPLPRHPSQLYEAALEGLLLFLVLMFVYHRPWGRRFGLCSGLFLLGYALGRTFVEFFREPDAQLGFLLGGLTMGQLLSLPMALLGLWLIIRSRRQPLPPVNEGA